jgi:hypothetical protein
MWPLTSGQVPRIGLEPIRLPYGAAGLLRLVSDPFGQADHGLPTVPCVELSRCWRFLGTHPLKGFPPGAYVQSVGQAT